MRIEPTPEGIQNDPDLAEYLSDVEDEPEEVIDRKCKHIEAELGLDDSFSNVVVVTGLPVVPQSKFQPLLQVVHKKLIQKKLLCENVEIVDSTSSIDLAVNEVGDTRGFALLTFLNSREARRGQKLLDRSNFDAKHVIHTCVLSELEEVVNRDENYSPPPREFPNFINQKDFRDWLLDASAREQFMLRYQTETEIYWNDPVVREPQLIHNGQNLRDTGKRTWTDFQVAWSTWGSYVASFHKRGIVLWAGPKFKEQMRMAHVDVKGILFSPNEEYLLTWDGSTAEHANQKAVIVWEIITGDMLRTFEAPPCSPSGDGQWPFFLWSYDGQYLAKCSQSEIFIYSVPSMNVLEDSSGMRCPIKCSNPIFAWSPAASILSVWSPPHADSLCRLVLIEIPSRKELASRSLHNAEAAQMVWQSKGDYLALSLRCWRKSGRKTKKVYTQIEIFRMKEKGIPVDTIRLDDGIEVQQLIWEEGGGDRLAVMLANRILFYQVIKTGAQKSTELVTTYDSAATFNSLQWSPQGSFFVMAQKGGDMGSLAFASLNENNVIDIIHKDSHYAVNDIRWDYSGRYVCTAVTMNAPGSALSQWSVRAEGSYNLWTFQGRLLHKQKIEQLYQFLWRPHPPALLSNAGVEDVQKRFKELSKKYDLADDEKRSEKREAMLTARNKMWNDFEQTLEALRVHMRQHPAFESWQNAYVQRDEQVKWAETRDTHEVLLGVEEVGPQ